MQMGLARLDGMKPFDAARKTRSTTRCSWSAAAAPASRRPSPPAGLGHPVVLRRDDEDDLGGLLAHQKSIAPEQPPYDAPQPNPFPS